MRRLGWIILSAGIVLTAVAYAPALEAGFTFDDEPNIVRATAVHWTELSPAAFSTLLDASWLPGRPVANLTFGLNHLVGGLDPWGYHLVNLLVHLLVGLSIAWLALIYLDRHGRRSDGRAPHVAVAVACGLFWLHPLNTQAVTYVVQRMTSMAALFCVVAFALYLTGRGERDSRARPYLFVAAFLAWLAAVGSKENALVLPMVLATYELCFHRAEWAAWWRRMEPGRRTLIAAGAGMAALVVAVAVVRLGGTPFDWSTPWARRGFNGWERMLTQSRVHVLYLSLLLWPAPRRLNLDHDFAVSRGLLDPWTTLAAGSFWAAFLVGAIVLARKKPLFGFPVLAYLELHLIESGPLNLELVFEHRMYLPGIMLALLAAALLHRSEHRVLKPAATLALAAGTLLAVATFARNRVWADPLAFATDVASKSPDKFRPQYNLGSQLGRAGRTAEAQAALLRAVALDPNHSGAHNQLGNTYLLGGEPERALAEYARAVELEPLNAEALYNLGMLLVQQGEVEEGTRHLRRFVEISPPWLGDAADRVRSRLGGPSGREGGP